jgi:two-component system response regulator MprA
MSRLLNVLLVDDDVRLLASLARNLSYKGFHVDTARSAGQALPMLRQSPPEVLVLDVTMPGMDGITFCRIVRQETSLPILMLTARDEVSDKVTGLEAGADDYLAKPFALDELVARLQALARRSNGQLVKKSTYAFRRVALDRVSWQATLDGSSLNLTTTEFLLLEKLMTEPERVFTREELLHAAWGEESAVESNAVDVHISNLRRKLEASDAGTLIRTVRRVGYGLQVPD